MRKSNWFKTAGVLTFAAQLLGGAGVAGATTADKACFPRPTFVSGGDPDITKADPDNRTKWTSSSGYGWSGGGPTEISYEGAIGPDATAPSGKHALFALTREMALPQISATEGVRLAFTYDYPKSSTVTQTVSQVVVIHFNTGDHAPGWSLQPTLCAGVTTGLCANDPNGDATMWQGYVPQDVKLLRKVDNGNAEPWGTPDVTWVKNNARLFVFVQDTTVDPKNYTYYWRLQIALPIRNGAAPNPLVDWTDQSIFLDANAFQNPSAPGDPAKVIHPFWLELLSGSSAVAGYSNKNYPDWATAPSRDTQQIPDQNQFAQSEIGSPRGAALLQPGDITCSGTGVGINADATSDNVVWHSDIWNTSAGDNVTNIFDGGGQLWMIDHTTHLPKDNRLAVKIVNTSTTKVDASKVKVQFLIAPYGSQAPKSIWSPLTTTGNTYTCGGSSTPKQTTCSPFPLDQNSLFDSTPQTAGTIDNTTPNGAILLMSDPVGAAAAWKPSPNYFCAVQTTETPGYDWYYTDPALSAQCDGSVWHPNTAAFGLPGHQCIQATLSGSGVTFATKSAFRNMHTETASLRREVATIDTLGLKKIVGQGYHDIYLYVDTHNMPYRKDVGYAPYTYQQAMSIYKRYNGGDCREGCIEGDCGCNPGPGFDPGVSTPSDEFFTKVMPTFIVHAYADVGNSEMVNGVRVPVFQELTAFGQYISHDSTAEGPVFGWDASLEPVAGTQFMKVGTNTWRIRIPNDKAGQVITHVEPLPSKRPVCSGTVNMNIVQLLQNIAPLIQVDNEDANEINALIDSLQIECVDLKWALDKITAKDWGQWTSWVKFLAAQVLTASGCSCQ
jgi:hypothetical protein